jgi:hypothetical protein
MKTAGSERNHSTAFGTTPPSFLAGNFKNLLQAMVGRAITSMARSFAGHTRLTSTLGTRSNPILDHFRRNERRTGWNVTVGPIMSGKFDSFFLELLNQVTIQVQSVGVDGDGLATAARRK